ncbi:islet cell autoantigen 1-like isoform X2 [Anneissia japonica]|uniref:islet cell autoantigen 1-like isoform X2 n=1 Tax=Anneissia japonica TaxID=1529436 RepID=UPI0014255F8A|nr:islet cell autoantigen 1-like isoform X2 [Anneissia japonica]
MQGPVDFDADCQQETNSKPRSIVTRVLDLPKKLRRQPPLVQTDQNMAASNSYEGSYSYSSYDRFVAQEKNSKSVASKVQKQYWKTKQAMIKKLGKKEDEFVVAGDAELDAKLDFFSTIQKTCMDLLRVIEKYQDNICSLSQEENAMGRFLKSHSGHNKTRAGKMMAAVGKAQSSASEQRLSLRAPLVRLYQEVETFRYRAISDTLMTINRMEAARVEYRAALLWMKDASKELDPDTYKQLEKFRKVQAQVRMTKMKFDKLKTDVCQKIDLLGASRCNMFSHTLVAYQNSILHFWERTSRTMSAVQESFQGYQHYEFNMLKDLTETSKQLAKLSGAKDLLPEDDDEAKDAQGKRRKRKNRQNGLSENGRKASKEKETGEGDEDAETAEEIIAPENEDEEEDDNVNDRDRLISFEEEIRELQKHIPTQQLGEFEDVLGGRDSNPSQRSNGQDGFQSLGNQDMSTEDNGEMSAYLSILGGHEEPSLLDLDLSPVTMDIPSEFNSVDLLVDEQMMERTEKERNDMALLNEILNTPSIPLYSEGAGPSENLSFFGDFGSIMGEEGIPESAQFLPSMLLDVNQSMDQLSLQTGLAATSQATLQPTETVSQQNVQTPETPSQNSGPSNKVDSSKSKVFNKVSKSDMSAWFDLFADLDPLANPDAIGKDGDKNQGI